jgi:hypothetical protein
MHVSECILHVFGAFLTNRKKYPVWKYNMLCYYFSNLSDFYGKLLIKVYHDTPRRAGFLNLQAEQMRHT